MFIKTLNLYFGKKKKKQFAFQKAIFTEPYETVTFNRRFVQMIVTDERSDVCSWIRDTNGYWYLSITFSLCHHWHMCYKTLSVLRSHSFSQLAYLETTLFRNTPFPNVGARYNTQLSKMEENCQNSETKYHRPVCGAPCPVLGPFASLPKELTNWSKSTKAINMQRELEHTIERTGWECWVCSAWGG